MPQQMVDFYAEIKILKSKPKTRFRCKQEEAFVNFRQGVTLLVIGMSKICK